MAHTARSPAECNECGRDGGECEIGNRVTGASGAGSGRTALPSFWHRFSSPSSVITLPSSDHGNRVDPAGEVMLPPIWPSDGVDSPAFWLAVLMWCVFFVVMRLLGKKPSCPPSSSLSRERIACTGKRKSVRSSLGLSAVSTLFSGRVGEFSNSVSSGNAG